MMTKAEYIARAADEDDWAPGWDAITEAFEALYPGVNPPHSASGLGARAVLGGTEVIDGVSFYPSPNGYQHLVTYGMSALYADERYFGGEESGWGYEMTIKPRAKGPEECAWASNSMRNLGRYTFNSKRWFEPYQYITGNGEPLQLGSDSLLTSYVTVPDTEVPGVDTVHGRLGFIQFVGVTDAEIEWIKSGAAEEASDRVRELTQRMAADGNVNLMTDLWRTKNYV